MSVPPELGIVGILGAGRVGTALARLARGAGLEVLIADPRSGAPRDRHRRGGPWRRGGHRGRGRPPRGCGHPRHPARQVPDAPGRALAGKLVIDAMNYWWELDGVRPEFSDPRTSTSETVQAFLRDSRLAKTFNHASVWELENLARPAGHPERRALAIACDAEEDMTRTSSLVDAMGFDPVPAGPLANGVMFEPGTEAFGADASAAELREMLNRFWSSQRGLVVARNRDMPPAEC